ncbi:MAG: DNA primase [Chloroflexota bacterium]|nr:DNA primase [Chloroflexota bacterium]
MSVVDEIKSRLDIVQYIERTTPLKRAGRVYKACCPFHSERTPSFTVDPARQTWRCFGACSTGGDVFTFAMKQNGWTFSEALQELGKLTGVEVTPRSPEQQARDAQSDRLRGLMKAAAEFYHDRLLDADDADSARTLDYVRSKRGLTDDTIERFMIGYAPNDWRTVTDLYIALGYTEDDLVTVGLAIRNDNGRVYDRFRNRLMIPIRDERGRVVGFGARALAAEDNPKYLNSPQTPLFDKSKLLFALDLAGNAIRQNETVVIVEGYLDAIQAHQAGYHNVVAQMGTALTETQLKLVAPRWANKIILALDSDAAGQSATRRSLEVARQTLQADYGGRLSVDIRILTVPDAKDPDDLIREHPQAWQGLIDNVEPVADYVIGMEVAELSSKASLQEREAVARRLLPILNASESNLYKKDNLQKLAMKLRIPERDLLAWANDQDVIARLKAPRPAAPLTQPPQPASAVPPAMDTFGEPPPLDMDVWSDPDGDAPLTILAPVTPQRRADAALERDCLRALLQQPDVIYQINRQFREMANGNADLLAGPLNDLHLDDFVHSEYRALASVYSEALEQDELEVIDYMRRHLEADLLREMEAIMAGDLAHLRPLLRHGLSADLESVMLLAQRTRAPIDPVLDATHKALRLRSQRLQRERQEVLFLQLDGQEQDASTDATYHTYIRLSAQAQRLIDTALREQSRTLQ